MSQTGTTRDPPVFKLENGAAADTAAAAAAATVMYGAAADTAAAADSERTAFRRAEKKYKLYRPQGPKSRKKGVENKTDVSDVVDIRGVCELFEMGGELPENVDGLRWPGMRSPVFRFWDRPGFYFIPNALTIEEQCYWIRESLTTFPQPPNRTNHTAIYGPISDLFSAVKSQKVLVKSEISAIDEKSGLSSGESNLHSCNYKFSEVNGRISELKSHKPIAASVLLRKLRWSTLGLQFDWSKRNYDVSLPHMKIPDTLSQLAKRLAAPAMPLEEEFLPEAAIVNYFGSSDMLGGHLDDMEVDWSKPIVSISLGCKAVFLLGGKSREDLPIAMFLHSGDVVLMASQARQCFHGVPRIFTDGEHAGISELVPQFMRTEDVCFMDYIKSSRININIRQVN